MGKIKIYLQYPWKFPDSPYYKYLVENPPENVEYLNIHKQKGSVTSMRKFFFLNFLKKTIRNSIKIFRIPLPNAHLTKSKQKYDIIHCAHCLSLNKKLWVTDIERFWQYSISGNNTKRELSIIKKLLASPYCKKILPWSEATKKDLLKIFPELRNKTEVVYPAVPVPKFKNKKSKKIKIIFPTRYFWIKGGLIALEVIKKVKEKYPSVEVLFISEVPEKIRKKYREIKIMKVVSHEKLMKHLSESDIFFYPSLMDTFGFSLLEALSFGLPVVSVNTSHTKSRKEIIKNGKNGFLIEYPKKDLNYYSIGKEEREVVNKLFKKLSQLIENKKLREKMSKNCIKTIKEGKFSIKERNKKLEKIYREALK